MPRVYTRKYTDEEWIVHRQEYVEEYYEEHKDEVARRKHRYYAEKQHRKNGHRCMMCGETSYLQVHHINYEHLGNESPFDLMVLCRSHHWVADEHRKHPEIPLWSLTKSITIKPNKSLPIKRKRKPSKQERKRIGKEKKITKALQVLENRRAKREKAKLENRNKSKASTSCAGGSKTQ